MVNRVFSFTGDGGGLVRDSNPFTLADNEWSDLLNVRLHDRAVSKISGHASLYGDTNLTTSPRYLHFINGGTPSTQFYYYINDLNDVFRIGPAGGRPTLVSNRLHIPAGGITSIVVTFVASTIVLSGQPHRDVEVGDVLVVSGVTGNDVYNTEYIVSSVSADGLTLTCPRINGDFTDPGNFTNAIAEIGQGFQGTSYQMSSASGGTTLLFNDKTEAPRYINHASAGTDNSILTPIPGWTYETTTSSVISAGELTGISVATNAVITLASENPLDSFVEVGDTLIVSGVTGVTDFNAAYPITSIDAARTSITTSLDSSGFSGTPVFTAAVADAGYNRYSNISAQTIRPFKYVWVAANLTKTDKRTSETTMTPGTIRVSNRAVPGALPTWDPLADSATTADEFTLSEEGSIVDLVSLGDILFAFTDNSIYAITVAGTGGSPVRSTKQLTGRGMLSDDCAVEFFGKLFVVGNEDIYLFQGGSATRSVADNRVRDYFFNNLNQGFVDNTFVVHNERHDEMWICYPTTDSSTGACDEALIWNYTHNTWTRRQLPSAYKGVSGPRIANNLFTLADQTVMLPSGPTGVGADPRIQQMDTGNTFDGTAFTASIERTGLDLAPNDPGLSKWTDEVFFLITGSGDVRVQIRATDTPGRTVDFNGSNDRFLRDRTFNITTEMQDLKIDPRASGKFFNIRISGSDEWALHNYIVSFDPAGNRSAT